MIDTKTKETNEEKPPSVFKDLLKVRNFKLLWAGETVSLMGDQFYFIALPLLVIMMSGGALEVGFVLAAAAVPRAVFMLVGGATTDRMSPRTVMILSNLVRFILVLSLAVFILNGTIEMWMVYFFAISFGVGDAFFYPAQMAIVPQIARKDQLQVANSIIMGMSTVAMFAGPVLAG